MRNFASSSFRLRDASFEIKLVYSFFLISVVIGLLTTGLFQFGRIGFSYERIVGYYLGGEIDGRVFFAKNLNALLEETHFHAFMMGVVFLVLAHLFLAASVRRGLKLFFIVVAFFSQLGDMGSVWLIRTQSPLFAYLLMAAWAGLWIGYSGMILIPLWDMWLMVASDAK